MNHNLKDTYVIGDVHGCIYTLKKLIKKIPKNARIIFVGDLCDKGNFSKDVFEFVINNNYECVKGNHEHLFEKYICDSIQKNKHSPWSSDKRYGGVQCIKSYDKHQHLIQKHLDWIQKLPTYIEVDQYFITHGFGLEFYDIKDEASSYKKLLLHRIYPDTIEPHINHNIINIFGHCPFDEVKQGKKYFCIDTGCATFGKLTAIQLQTHTIIEEDMDERDSNFRLKELHLKDIDTDRFTAESFKNITLKKGCKYNSYDIISNDILMYALKTFPKEAKQEIHRMKEDGVIFIKQADKVLSEL